MCTPSAGSRRQAAPPPVPIGLTGWIAVALWIGCFTMPRADSTSSAMAAGHLPSTATAPPSHGTMRSPATLSFTLATVMWASLGGRDANGELLIIHCASGYNNVVITGKKGFTSIGRPQYYAEAGHS